MTKIEKVRIRKHGMFAELYLQRDGTWGAWNTAKRMTQDAAERFAEKCGIKNTEYGLFP